MLELIGRAGDNDSLDIIMFEELSATAQEKALNFAGVDDITKQHWDICPIAYVATMPDSQDAIDEEALTQIGVYRLTA